MPQLFHPRRLSDREEFKAMSKPEKDQIPGLRLTERELEVLRLVAKGLNNREIARQLFISENTVKNHVRNILEKLQLHSRMEAVMYAVREKLLDRSEEHTSELQSLMRISYAVFCLKKKNNTHNN